MVQVVAAQPRVHLTYPAPDRFDQDAIERNINVRVEDLDQAKQGGADLILFPEFFLTGYTRGVDVDGWIKANVDLNGPEIGRHCGAAAQRGICVAGAACETIRELPRRFFNTAFLIGPCESILLNYRKLYTVATKSRPSDVLDQWVDIFRPQCLFPVADTPIGRNAIFLQAAIWITP